MLSANSPNAKYLAGFSALLTATLFLGVLPADPETTAPSLIGAAAAYVTTFYFLGRTFTTDIVVVSRRRTAPGFVLGGIAVTVWLYATLVFRVDLTAPGATNRAALVIVVAGLLVGLAHVGWTTGTLAESLAIQRARGGRRQP